MAHFIESITNDGFTIALSISMITLLIMMINMVLRSKTVSQSSYPIFSFGLVIVGVLASDMISSSFVNSLSLGVLSFLVALLFVTYAYSHAFRRMLFHHNQELVVNGKPDLEIMKQHGITYESIMTEAERRGVIDIRDIEMATVGIDGRISITPFHGIIRKPVDIVTGLPMSTEATPEEGYSAIMLDLKGITEVNRLHGFQAGDDVLRHVSHMINNRIRPEDHLFRHTKDRFIVLIKAEEVLAIRVMDDINRKIGDIDPDQHPYITKAGLSFSIKHINCESVGSTHELIEILESECHDQ